MPYINNFNSVVLRMCSCSSRTNLQTSLKLNRPVWIYITYEHGQPSVYQESKTHLIGIAGSVLKTHACLFGFFFLPANEPYFCLAVDINGTQLAH